MFRAGALYLVCAWLIAQVADVVIGLGEFPAGIGRVVLLVLALGFPVSLVASWFFDWTPAGIRLDSEAAATQRLDQPGRRRLDYVIISLLCVALAYFIATHDWRGRAPADSPSIAVLPFANRSAQPDDLYFTDGIHEDILTQLGKISSILVISRSSVMRYRDSDKTVPEIAAELGVATILEGGVQRAGNRVRINLQLIDAATDRHLWAETFDRELSAENVFAIQSEIASMIARTLRARLLPQERQNIETAPTESLEAYDAYLLGRRSLATRRPDELLKARTSFERAIHLDPKFALAYTGLADTLILTSNWVAADAEKLLQQAEDAARRALELNPELGEAHTSLGLVREFRGAPADEFFPYLERGVELAPASADARKWYANYLHESGHEEEALAQLLVAVRLDPMSPIIRTNLAVGLRSAGRREEALVQIRQALEIDPQFQAALSELWELAAFDEALLATARAYRAQQAASNPWVILELVLSYLTLGDDGRAESWLSELDRVAVESIPSQIAHLNLGLFRAQEAEASKWAEALYPIEGGITVPSRALLIFDLRRGDLEAAMTRYRGRYPELLVDDPQVTDLYPVAIDVAILFRALGEPERAERLLARSLAYLASRPASEVGENSIFLARIHALQGNPDEALTALRQAIKAGWRRGWWFYLKQDPAFDVLRDDARFRSILADIDAEMSTWREKIRQLENSGRLVLPPES